MPDERTASISVRLRKKLDVTHRIADTQKVNAMQLPSLQTAMRLIPLLVIGIGGIFLAVMFFVKGIPANVHYHFANDSGERIEVTGRPQDNGDILIRGVKEKSFQKHIPASEFFQTPGLEPKVIPDRTGKFVVITTMVLTIAVPLLLCFVLYREHRKARQIRGLLGLLDQDDDSKIEDAKGESRTTSA